MRTAGMNGHGTMKAHMGLACLLALLAGPALAQDGRSGSVTIRGYVGEMASLSFRNAEAQGEGARAFGGASVVVDLGDVGVVEGRDNGFRGGNVELLLRSNARYVLTATVHAAGFKEGEGEVSLADIGFGLPSEGVVPSGRRAKAEGTAHGDAAFDSDPMSAPVVGGRPQYDRTLADLDGESILLTGERISYGGSVADPENALVVSTRYAMLPQYFKKNAGFEAVIVYTLGNP